MTIKRIRQFALLLFLVLLAAGFGGVPLTANSDRNAENLVADSHSKRDGWFAPQFSVAMQVLESNCPGVIDHGDSLVFVISNPTTRIQNNRIYADLFDVGSSFDYMLRNDPAHFDSNAAGFSDDVWTDTIALISYRYFDSPPGHSLRFEARDEIGELGTVWYIVDSPIDMYYMWVDSIKLYPSENHTGSDESIALGDELRVDIYMSSNGIGAIDSVRLDISLLRSDSSWLVVPEDPPNSGNFAVSFYLTTPMPLDTPGLVWPYDKVAAYHIWGRSCEYVLDSLYYFWPIDLDPPDLLEATYWLVDDLGPVGCAGLGDSIIVQADLSGDLDIVEVTADLFNAGLGGTKFETLYDDGTNNDAAHDGIWTRGWRVGRRDDAALDPPDSVAKDLNSFPVDADYTVKIVAVDDAGNTSTQLVQLRTANGGVAVDIDSRRPSPIIFDSLRVVQISSTRFGLYWPASPPSQAPDASLFRIFADSTNSGFDFSEAFDSVLNGAYANPVGPDSNAWFSPELDATRIYRFAVRTVDDCGNPELISPYVAVGAIACGDCDASGRVDIGDVVAIVNYIFADGRIVVPKSLADSDCSSQVDISDAVYLINYIFGGGGSPCSLCP